MDKKDLEAIAQIVNSAMQGAKKDLRDEMSNKMNEFEEKMLDKMFLFEQEYGQKIDAIFGKKIKRKRFIKIKRNLEFKLTI